MGRGSFFSTLGIKAVAGRVFTEANDVPGGGSDGAVAVISYEFSRRRFDSPAAAIGRRLVLDKMPFTIIGVTPADFFGLEVGHTFDVIVPFAAEPLLRGRESWLTGRGAGWLTIMARLKPQQNLEAAAVSVRAVQRSIWEATLPNNARPEFRQEYLNESFAIVPAAVGQSMFRDRYRRPLLALMIVVALVLLIACANLANLLMARASTRQHELSVRLALGAPRWRLARQLLTESAVLAAAGAVSGLVIASWTTRLLVHQLSTSTETVFLDVGLDARMLIVAIAIAATTTILFGTAPAVTASRHHPASALRTWTQQAHATGSWNWIVVAQVALSLALLVTAGLFMRTFVALATRPLGFERDRVLVVGLDSRQTAIPPAQRVRTYDEVRERVRGVPGVTDAGVSMLTPVDPLGALVARAEVTGGAPMPAGQPQPFVFTNVVSPDWFRTFGVPLLAGRDFTMTDGPNAPRVAIVNETLARQFLANGSPLGHTITLTLPARAVSMEIIGVVADAVYLSVRENIPATVYTPLAQLYVSPAVIDAVSLSVRTANGAPAGLTKAVTTAIGDIAPQLTLTFQPFVDQLSASVRQERIVAELSGSFAALALLLSALGLYGVTAGSVVRRRSEIAIRIALGATSRAILQLVMSCVAVLVAAGLGAGAVLSLWASQFIAAMLYGVQPRDSVTILASAILLAGTAALAGWLPARGASRTEPAQVLRES